MAKKNLSEIERGAGFFEGFVTNLMAVVREQNVPFEALYRLVKPEGRETLKEMVYVAQKAFQPLSAVPQAQQDYFTQVLDADVPESHKATVAKYRKLASEHGVPTTTVVCYRVRAGFTLKSHAAKAGPCIQGFQYLQNWNFPDEPTVDCLVFWVPCILKDSKNKTKDEQTALLADTRTKLELPAHHMSSFGKVALVAGLILAHYKATKGEHIPLGNDWVRTDTCSADGDRLRLGDFGGAGLDCGDDRWGDGRRARLGAFALGVELGS